MASIINASTTGIGGLITSADSSGILQLQTGGTTAVTINASQNVGIGTTAPETALSITKTSPSFTIPTENGIHLMNSDGYASAQLNGVNGGFIDFALGGTDYRGRIIYTNSTNNFEFATNATTQMALTSAGNLQFNSGYGSAATAYGCRAWVNFNGTGTVAIRASGNVSSITDNGVGDYTINFTTAMPDINYATIVNTQGASTASMVGEWSLYGAGTATQQAPTTSNFRMGTWNSAVSALADTAYVMAAVFR